MLFLFSDWLENKLQQKTNIYGGHFGDFAAKLEEKCNGCKKKED